MTMRQLLAKRAALIEQMRAAQDEADATSGGTMTEEQAAAFEALKAALADLEAAMSRRALVEEAERRMQGQPLAGSGDRNLDAAMRGFSVARAIAHMGRVEGVDAGREREMSAELARRSGRHTDGMIIPFSALETRVVTTATPVAGPGGRLISTVVDGGNWIDALRPRSVLLNAGATVLSELNSYLNLPRLKTPATVAFAAENAPFPFSDQAWEAMELRPRSAGGNVEISRSVMLNAAAPGIEEMVRRDLMEGIARVIDKAAVSGAGGVEPVGILNTPGVGVVALNGPLTVAAIADMIGTVQDANADANGETFAFIGSPSVRRAAAKLLDGMNRPLGLDTVFQGYNYSFSNQIPAGTLLFGDVSSVYVGMWGNGIELLANPFAQDAFARGNVQIRVVATCDVGLRHPEQWVADTGIAAA